MSMILSDYVSSGSNTHIQKSEKYKSLIIIKIDFCHLVESLLLFEKSQ